MASVVVIVEGGVVASVLADTPNVIVEVFDRDVVCGEGEESDVEVAERYGDVDMYEQKLHIENPHEVY